MVSLRPEYAEAWYNRGVALVALGRYAEAVTSYDCVIAINPEDADAWLSRGYALAVSWLAGGSRCLA